MHSTRRKSKTDSLDTQSMRDICCIAEPFDKMWISQEILRNEIPIIKNESSMNHKISGLLFMHCNLCRHPSAQMIFISQHCSSWSKWSKNKKTQIYFFCVDLDNERREKNIWNSISHSQRIQWELCGYTNVNRNAEAKELIHQEMNKANE